MMTPDQIADMILVELGNLEPDERTEVLDKILEAYCIKCGGKVRSGCRCE